MASEEWKCIAGYEGLYEVSNTGKVRSVPHLVKSRYLTRITPGKELRQSKTWDGYLNVCLCKDNTKKTRRVHRLVAEAFLDNPMCYPVVNHKDENKTNNNVDNLEFCTVQYNTNYNGCNIKRSANKKKKIVAYNESDYIIFDSVTEASKKLNVSHGDISGCLHNHYGRQSLRGYKFKFYQEASWQPKAE